MRGIRFEGRFSGRLVQQLNSESSVVVNNGRFCFTTNTEAQQEPALESPTDSGNALQIPNTDGDPTSQTICIACAGSGRCNVCKGTGKYSNYGISDTCSACHGSGICTICGGEGSY